MISPTTAALAYIEQQYKEIQERVEVQRRVVEQLHTVEAHPGQGEATLRSLLDDEAAKLRILDYLRKWRAGCSKAD